MFLHAHEIEAVAKNAAAIYGQTWESIPQHSKQIWLQTVQGASPDDVGVSDAEKAACAALREWRHAQTLPNAATEEVAQVETVQATPKAKNKVR